MQHAVATFDGVGRGPEACVPAQAKTALDHIIVRIGQVAFLWRFVSGHGTDGKPYAVRISNVT